MLQQDPISLELACSNLQELWSPRVAGQVPSTETSPVHQSGSIQGEFPWHTHDHEDELFFVLRGHLRIGRAEADGGPVSVLPISVLSSEFFVVPRGTRHNTSAQQETWIALIETTTTLHTGSEQTPLTRTIAQQLG